jgi:predicted Zn-dependent peptidase
MSLARTTRKSLITLCLIWLLNTVSVSAQEPLLSQEPQREQLLNGLRILLWQRPGDKDVLIKLRIHSGAAFDWAGKAGQMAVLGDILFPDATTREYFTDALGGRLDVYTDYDSITVTMQGRASEFDRIAEILRTAIVAPQLTTENVAKIRDGRIKIAKDTIISPTIMADRAIASRLFGDFPYGRPQTGSAESLARLDRADLLLARERFLNPNNATLAIFGGVEKNKAMRTLRQLLGVWRKSETIAPATFRQPEAPDVRTLIINAPADGSAEIRLATRGLARSDRDFVGASILAVVARKRWETLLPELGRSPVFVRHEAYSLPGMFVMGASVNNSLTTKALEGAREVVQSLVKTPVTAAMLEQAKTEAIGVATQQLAKPDGALQAWLDIDTYGLTSRGDQMLALNQVTAADLQRIAARLFGERVFASVVVGDSEKLKALLAPTIKIELMGEVPTPSPTPNKSESKPATVSTPKPD